MYESIYKYTPRYNTYLIYLHILRVYISTAVALVLVILVYGNNNNNNNISLKITYISVIYGNIFFTD